MFRKALVVSVAALTLAGSVAATSTSAEAGWRGAAIAAGVFGVAAGAALAASARPVYARPVYYGGYGGCGYVSRPFYDSWGNYLGYRRVPAC